MYINATDIISCTHAPLLLSLVAPHMVMITIIVMQGVGNAMWSDKTEL